jgi:hypothetical protein
MEPKQEEELDQLFQDARCYQIGFDYYQNLVSRDFRVENTQAAINALDHPPTFSRNRQTDITVISIATKGRPSIEIQQNFEVAFSWSAWSIRKRAYGIHANGPFRMEDDSARFDTPMSGGTYVILFLNRSRGYWQGYIMHDMGDAHLSAVMPSNEDFPHSVPSSRYSDRPDRFIRIIASKLGLHWLKELRRMVNRIERQIANVNAKVIGNAAHHLSESMLELNKCSDYIRSCRLEHQTAYGFELASWIYGSLGVRSDDELSFELYKMVHKPLTLYSAPLKEAIADVRARIADIAAQQRQEREEQRWTREEQRWKEREEFEKRKDEEKLQRERERQDAIDAYEREKERLQAERESERFEQEKQQRSEELQRQNARQALEDKRAKDAAMLQQLSIEFAKQSIALGEASLRDSRTMRGIAWLTMAFLPATFVTSFFGMNFFNVVPGTPVFDETSRNVWVFFVVALPISAIVMTGFWFWDRKTQRMVATRERGPR